MKKILLIFMLSCAGSVAAEEADSWQIQFQPYVWALGNEVRIATTDYDRSDSTGFIDALLNQYQYGFLWTTTARKGRWGVYMDGHIVRLKDEAKELGLPYTSDIWQAMFEGSIMYHHGDDSTFAEVFAGGRYFLMNSDVDVTLVGSFNDNFEWVEPLVGGRLSHQLGKKEGWRAEVAADIGGFGVGSDLTWQASGALHYAISERHTLSMGYRHIDIEYRDQDYRYESEMSGPFIGLGLKF